MSEQSNDFAVDPSYVTRQLQNELQVAQEALILQRAGFAQLTDMFNQRTQEKQNLEDKLAAMRAEIEEHEKFAVTQQTTINDHTDMVKRFGFSTFEAFAAEFDRITGNNVARQDDNEG